MTSRQEEEYFARKEVERMMQAAKQLREEMAVAEQDRLKELHWNRCARCGFELEEVIFKGVKIDKCFHCGGVFLDSGELEKLCGSESRVLDAVRELFKF